MQLFGCLISFSQSTGPAFDVDLGVKSMTRRKTFLDKWLQDARERTQTLELSSAESNLVCLPATTMNDGETFMDGR